MGRKNPKLILDGHDFRIEKNYDKSSFWVCTSYSRTKCKARLITKENVVIFCNQHNHEPKHNDTFNLACRNVTIIKKNSFGH